ncbi:MAG: caspase family protein, partial [Arenicellales bacterium]|nr:caspase family protein [Arenicellales bacterium]
HLDQAADEGYWLPIDADRSDQSNWIATDRIVSQVKAMQAKHVMVVADSCFSGTMTRAIKIEQRTPDYLQRIVKTKSRTVLTSGGLEPVMDSGSGNHSAFAHAFISLLEDNDGVLDAAQLFSELRPKVMVNSDQTPEYGDIRKAGHDGGDFLFVRH